MSSVARFRQVFDEAHSKGAPVVISWELASAVAKDLDELGRAQAILKRLLAVDGDHMSACDRIMGDTHPCTCGADRARQLFSESE